MTEARNQPDDEQKGEKGEAPPPAPTRDDIARLDEALKQSRSEAKATLAELNKVRNASLSETEKAVHAAREEGRKEAVQAAGKRLAIAEFRAQAAGKLADPGAATEYLDMARFVNDDGEPDVKAIASAVEKLAAASAAPPADPPPAGNGKPVFPQGARAGAAGGQDWLQQVLHGKD